MHMQATTSANSGRWNASRKYGSVSLYLVLGTVIYTLTLALLALGLAMGFAYRDQCYYRGPSRYNSYRDDYSAFPAIIIPLLINLFPLDTVRNERH